MSNIYTIPASVSFIDSLANGILSRYENKNFTDLMVLLPNRRSCRALKEALLEISNKNAVLLPLIKSMEDADEAEFILSGSKSFEEYKKIPSAISPLKRIFYLSDLILELNKDEIGSDQSINLAYELSLLLNEIQREEIDFSKLKTDVPRDLAKHWEITLDFLKLISSEWPKALKDMGLIDYMERKNLLINKQAELWAKNPPKISVIAAGSTGSTPAKSNLLKTISKLKNGIIVLPHLDKTMNKISWDNLDSIHPQNGLKNLLNIIGTKREDIKYWEEPKNSEREKLFSHAMLPSKNSHDWSNIKITQESINGLSRVEVENQQDEANLISIIIREAVENTNKKIALITNDRNLAKRVSISLKRWGIEIDDSAGKPLNQSPSVVFLKLIIEMIASNFSPVQTLSVLKHPLFYGKESRENIHNFEQSTLRKNKTINVFDAVEKEGELYSWIQDIKTTTDGLYTLLNSRKNINIKEALKLHMNCAEKLSEMGTGKTVWQNDEDEEILKIIEDAGKESWHFNPLSYSQIFDSLWMLDSNYYANKKIHSRISILSPIESRLLQHDTTIIGGVNKGSWPKEHSTPWMNKFMQSDFGLDLSNKKIGLSANDFFGCACAPEVIITRSKKSHGSPTIPSPWLLRLDAVLKSAGLDDKSILENKYIYWSKLLNKPSKFTKIKRPAPTPPESSRPKKLPATGIEKLLKNPYSIYARYILKLKPLDKINETSENKDFGIIVHEILSEFVENYESSTIEKELEILISVGKKKFNSLTHRPSVLTVWFPRFIEIAKWFVKKEREKRLNDITVFSEIEGSMEIEGLIITAKADRIEIHKNTAEIIDYKTGKAPAEKDVKTGMSSQLTIESLILENGGFKNIINTNVKDISYWELSGNRTSEEIVIKEKKEKLISDAKNGLTSLIKTFNNGEAPYISSPYNEYKTLYNDYDHLERIKEWSFDE